MKILFLHGWHSTPGGVESTFLKSHGHEVLNPALPDDDFDAAVRIAQAEFDNHHPDVVVGSSRGGLPAREGVEEMNDRVVSLFAPNEYRIGRRSGFIEPFIPEESAVMKKALILLVFLSWSVSGQTEEPPKQIRPEDVKKVLEDRLKRLEEQGYFLGKNAKKIDELQERIKAELGTLKDHPWAGEYYLGDGLDNNYMTIAPQAGFLYMHRGDIGLGYANYGAVEEKDGKLRLSLSVPYEKDRYRGLSKELIPIAWGERKYLVSSETMIHFCNQINEGQEPRNRIHGFCFLREGDEKKKVNGLPTISKEFRPYLLTKPIDTEIISVSKPITSSGKGEVNKTVINVTIRHGKNAGLLPGMTLHIIKPRNVFDPIKLAKVEEEQSEGEITRYHLTGMLGMLSLLEKNPEIGWKLSTRSLWGMEKEDKAKKSMPNKGQQQ